MSNFTRPLLARLIRRLSEPRRFVQVLAGPRQVGKTTLARQAVERLRLPKVYATADGVMLEDRPWIETQWSRARALLKGAGRASVVLVLDEVQKIRGWSEVVKRLWDDDTAHGRRVRVLLLGSSPLLVERGLTESLAGRFEMLPVAHWSLAEMRDAFGWSPQRYVRFGGYPGSAALVRDHERWQRYVLDSLVETTVSRDILLMSPVEKPALLRRLFELACTYSGQVLSYNKMLGQLQDAGNTTTLAHYLDLLGGAGLVRGLPKYSRERHRQRSSSPKLLVLNTALMTAVSGRLVPLHERADESEWWGRLVESAVGAHLVNSTVGMQVSIAYWLDRNREVDFVLHSKDRLLAIEVKSGRRRTALPGLEAFRKAHPKAHTLLVGADGVPLEEFLLRPAAEWLED